MITTKNINMQTPAYTITIGEIIEEFEKAKTRKEKKLVLEKYVDIDVLRNLFRGIYDPKVQWTITETPDYVVQEAPEGSDPNTLYNEIPK